MYCFGDPVPSLVGNDIELDAVGRQFEPYRGMRSYASVALRLVV